MLRSVVTSELCSRIAGIPVLMIDIVALPYSDVLFSGRPLTKEMARARETIIKKEAKVAGVKFDAATIQICAKSLLPYFHSYLIQIPYQHAYIPINPGHLTITSRDNAKLCLTFGEKIPVKSAFRNQQAIILHHGRNIRPEHYWPNWLDISKEWVTHYPKGNHFRLGDLVHEFQHALQAEICPRSFAYLFYTELDAESSARSQLRRSPNSTQTLVAGMHGYYIKTLNCRQDHLIAPTLDAIENSRKPPNFYQIQKAVGEIRLRLYMKHHNLPENRFSSRTLQSALAAHYRQPGCSSKNSYLNIAELIAKHRTWQKPLLKNHPDVLFGLLQQLIDDGVFTESLAVEMAQKIMNGARYFIPALKHSLGIRFKAARLQTRPQSLVA